MDISPRVKIFDGSQVNLKILMLFRCTTLNYAQTFLERGLLLHKYNFEFI